MSDSADAICNVMNHAEAVERREASPLTASKAGKGGTLPFSWAEYGLPLVALVEKRLQLGAFDAIPFCNCQFGDENG